jgi:amino acid transporter
MLFMIIKKRGGMPLARGLELFQQSAVGFTRQISPMTRWFIPPLTGTHVRTRLFDVGPFLYPGAHMSWAILTVSQMFVIAGLYWLLSVAMPRQGGEYIYISRICIHHWAYCPVS